MPAYSRQANCLAVKLVTMYAGNPAKGLPSHMGIVVVFDASTGSPQAVSTHMCDLGNTVKTPIYRTLRKIEDKSPNKGQAENTLVIRGNSPVKK